MSGNWLETAREVLKVPGLLVEIYGDLAKPGVRQAGKALETIIGLGNTILWPILWANERSRIYLERNLESYRQRMAEIPEHKVIPVVPELGVPIVERLSYVADPQLAELYVNLLAKASSSDLVSKAHPSFVNIINNLSPDEVQLLECFRGVGDIAFARAIWASPKGTFKIAAHLLVGEDITKKVRFAENIPAYFSNLEGLGLVNIVDDEEITNDKYYKQIEQLWSPLFPPESAPEPGRKLEFSKGLITLTVFGRLFISACRT